MILCKIDREICEKITKKFEGFFWNFPEISHFFFILYYIIKYKWAWTRPTFQAGPKRVQLNPVGLGRLVAQQILFSFLWVGQTRPNHLGWAESGPTHPMTTGKSQQCRTWINSRPACKMSKEEKKRCRRGGLKMFT